MYEQGDQQILPSTLSLLTTTTHTKFIYVQVQERKREGVGVGGRKGGEREREREREREILYAYVFDFCLCIRMGACLCTSMSICIYKQTVQFKHVQVKKSRTIWRSLFPFRKWTIHSTGQVDSRTTVPTTLPTVKCSTYSPHVKKHFRLVLHQSKLPSPRKFKAYRFLFRQSEICTMELRHLKTMKHIKHLMLVTD